MDDDSERSDKSNDSSSPPIVRITVVEPPSEEEAAPASSLNDDINNEYLDSEFANVEIPKQEFHKRIQDVGCSKEELKVKRYESNIIPGYGPKLNKNYYGLGSIVIDYSKNFKKQHELQRGWSKTPKNQMEFKGRIIERILAMRKYCDIAKENQLDQVLLLDYLNNMWGQSSPRKVLYFNDRLRLFGTLMMIPEHRLLFERLAKGVANKDILDHDAFHPKNIFQKLTWDFCNDSVKVVLPSNCTGVDGWDSLDANDKTRTRIHRDCGLFNYMIYSNYYHLPSHIIIIITIGTWTKNVFDNTISQYKAMITKWFLGTGGG